VGLEVERWRIIGGLDAACRCLRAVTLSILPGHVCTHGAVYHTLFEVAEDHRSATCDTADPSSRREEREL